MASASCSRRATLTARTARTSCRTSACTSALKGVVVDIGLNNRMLRFSDALSRLNHGSIAFARQSQAGKDWPPVHNDGAGSAGPLSAAPVFGRGKTDFIAQELSQAPIRFDPIAIFPAIHSQLDGTEFGHSIFRRCSTFC